MYLVVFATRAKKDLRRHDRSGSFPLAKLERAIDTMAQGQPLPLSYEDHALKGSLAGQREFHLAYDILVQYKRNDELRIITITAVGTHAELFGN